MARKKILLSLSAEHYEVLKELMKDYFISGYSSYIASLLGAEKKRLDAEKNKRPVGRPNKVVRLLNN